MVSVTGRLGFLGEDGRGLCLAEFAGGDVLLDCSARSFYRTPGELQYEIGSMSIRLYNEAVGGRKYLICNILQQKSRYRGTESTRVVPRLDLVDDCLVAGAFNRSFAFGGSCWGSGGREPPRIYRPTGS